MTVQCICHILEGKIVIVVYISEQISCVLYNTFYKKEYLFGILKMNRPNYLTCEEIDDEIIISDDDVSETEDDSEEFFPESESDQSDDNGSDTENENNGEQLVDSNENMDPSFVSKDGIVWNPQPMQVQGGRLRTENVISLHPGVTRYAKSRVEDIKRCIYALFPTPIEKIILKHTNAYIEGRKNVSIIPIDANLLYAYIGVLILAGVHR